VELAFYVSPICKRQENIVVVGMEPLRVWFGGMNKRLRSGQMNDHWIRCQFGGDNMRFFTDQIII
jgi:hypothetical protein